MNKRGSIQDLVVLMIVLFALGIVLVVANYSFDAFKTKMVANPTVNSSQETLAVLDTSVTTNHRLDYISFAILMGFVLAIIITSWIVGGHPLFSIIYIIGLILLVAFSAVFSFIWNRIATNNILASTVEAMPISNHILSNLPIYLCIVGFIGVIVLYAKPQYTE